MKILSALTLILCALSATADDGRIQVHLPNSGRWKYSQTENGVPGLVKRIPGIVSSRLVKSSRQGHVIAEVVLLTGIPALRYSALGARDWAIEPFLHREDGPLSLIEALHQAASNLGGGLQSHLVGRTELTGTAALEGSEAFVIDGLIQPRWRAGIQYVKLRTKQTALLVYRVDSRRLHARTWQELREILRSPRLVRPV